MLAIVASCSFHPLDLEYNNGFYCDSQGADWEKTGSFTFTMFSVGKFVIIYQQKQDFHNFTS